MADPDSDEEETFVVIGTPLEVYEEGRHGYSEADSLRHVIYTKWVSFR